MELHLSLAGLGSRAIAQILDTLAQILFGLALLVVLLLFTLIPAVEHGLQSLGELIGAVVVALFSLMLTGGYYVLFEVLWNGQTPGKRIVGIRAIRENGQPIDFFTSVTRTLLRTVDFLPVGYLVGIISILATRQYKRVGDFVAGTLVVKEYGLGPRTVARLPGLAEAGSQDAPAESELSGPVATANVGLLSREEAEAAHRYLERRAQLPVGTERSLARQLALPLMRKLDVPETEGFDYARFLEDVWTAWRRRQRLRE